MVSKIKNLTLRNFRGISTRVDLSLTSSQGKPVSVLILGDNGSGKSSLADAFEFCLRGRISRRGNAGVKERREARNLLLPGKAPLVSVELDNGKKFFRGQKQFSGGQDNLESAFGERLGDFAPGYALCPIVLSRSDIEVFWKLAPGERMRFFFDYLRDSASHAGYIALDIERNQQELRDVRADLLEAQIGLAVAAKIPVSGIRTRTLIGFQRWRNKEFPRQPERERRRMRTQKRIQAALDELETQIKLTAKIRQHIASQKRQAGSGDLAPPVLSADIPELLRNITSQVSDDFSEISGLAHIKRVQVSTSKQGDGLDIFCILPSGRKVDPVQVLSEGALDLLALLIMLGVTLECAKRGQSRFVILDDVWQSVDAVHRNSILDFIFEKRFKDWQLVITVHDRLWARLVEEKARKRNFPIKTVEISSWSAEYGPVLTDTSLSTVSQLKEMLLKSAPESLCAYAGRSLEELANRLSMAMRVSVPRAPGDRYTLEDLWPGVFKGINKSALPEGLKEAARKVNEIYALRNIYGAHYSTWAESMSRMEVENFASFVIDLWERVHYATCGQSIAQVYVKRERAIDWPCGHNDAGALQGCIGSV
ncbi:AAA family ATPase [Streptomyces sp. NPDC097595]|uniref:AAA family ATPase n=1 Tax=Streptomyces sp. NPDC097595 TaxID=3366090 RepID=UPI00382EC0CD